MDLNNKSNAMAVIVVTHESAGQVADLARSVIPQLGDDDEFVIVDNASTDGTSEIARSFVKSLTIYETGANSGFSGGCQVGVQSTNAPLLFMLNPDAQLHADCLERLRDAAATHPDWGAWQAAVLLPDGSINTSGGVVHYLGFGWAGDCGRPLAQLPGGDREVSFPSGAAMVVRRQVWEEIGGLDHAYFMYGEDLDLGLRLWLSGYGVGLVPAARVTHSYEFDKGPDKWFWLERNRWRTVLSVYPAPLLALLAPALFAAELGLIGVAGRQGWLGPKLRAQVAALKDIRRTLARRRKVQRKRDAATAEFAFHLTSSLDSPYLGVGRSPLLSGAQAAYWRLVRGALAALTR